MTINRVSFVGVPANFDLESATKNLIGQSIDLHLDQLINNYTLEFGMLYSPQRSDKRYISLDDVFEISAAAQGCRYPRWKSCLSLHLCGNAVRDFWNKSLPAKKLYYMKKIQLNFRLNETDVIEEIVHKSLEALEYYGDNFDDECQVIFQANKSKKALVEYLQTCNLSKNDKMKIRLLHDASGGLGKEIQNVQPPFSDYYTGYAGGINPLNAYDICEKVIKASKFTNVYIDMESGIRDDHDEFSLDKCKDVLVSVDSAILKYRLYSKVGF